MSQQMPLIQALLDYSNQGIVRFHMPGHKGGQGFSQEFIRHLAGMDVTEIPGLDNLHNPQGPIEEAEQLAATAFGADKTWFLVNGSTCGVHAMIMATCPPGSKLIIPRNCHKSVWNALVLGDIQPIYIQPEYDYEKGIPTQIRPDKVAATLQAHPDVRGMLLVHPNYYGMCAHVKEIANILHIHGKLLLVDEAHGAHLPFHPDLPSSAGGAGADLWVQSAHKTLPAFTQSAYLHGRQGNVDFCKVSEVLSIVQSSSPSYMLMGSLDWARNIMSYQGKELLDNLIKNLEELRRNLKNGLGIDSLIQGEYLGEGKRREIFALDPTRLVLDLQSLGITGYQGELLLRQHGLQVEMSDHRHIILICTISDTKKQMKELLKTCEKIGKHGTKPSPYLTSLSISREIPEQMLSPRQAFYSLRSKIPLKESIGRICATTIGAYPPGIPRYCPGELIQKEGVEELLSISKMGANIFGLCDRGLVSVVKKAL